ncbi:MAG: response regulator [Spirochaetaceae bacterium]|nr:MAG: response regulator [Spirochaetaceae bacterium]
MVYNVLLVDDERIIREGLAKKVPWSRYDLTLCGQAADGEEGLERINQEEIHVVITDIKMPGIDGLELIRRAQQIKPDVRFIVLSGYDEFEFAQTAMQYGVRHYLLKPTKMQEIDRILKEVSLDLARQEEERSFVAKIKQNMERNLPLIKEQFFRDLIMHKMYTSREMNSYLSFLGITPKSVQNVTLLLFSPSGDQSYEKLFSLQLICQRCLQAAGLVLSTIIKEALVAVVKDTRIEELLERIEEIKSRFGRFYDQPVTVAVSGSAALEAIHNLYKEARNLLKHSFYYGEDSVITRQEAMGGTASYNRSDLQYYIEEACLAIQCGHEREYRAIIESFWSELKTQKVPQRNIRDAVIDLLLTAARYDGYERLNYYIDYLKRIEETDTLEGLEKMIDECCSTVVRRNFEQFSSRKSRLVEKLKDKTRENLTRPELTLKWLAQTLVYANVDYLSKLFKRETGENFKHYLTRMRVEEAKNLLKQFPGLPVAEVARSVGFGENARYFCTVFRKCVGQPPAEYRRGCQRVS